MQSLDSSCQEADFIINDTILKLKGTSTNNNSSLRQTTQLPSASQQQQQQQQLHSSYPSLQHQPPQQLTQTGSQQTHHSLLHHSSSSSLSSLTNLSQIHHQPPPYIFDDAESPTDYSSLPTSISDHDLLASVGVVSDTHQQMSVLTDTLASFNSIISPSPVVPEMIFSTSSTSPTLNCSKPEKQSLLSDSSPSSILYNSTSSPGKKVKLGNTSLYGSPPLLQTFGSSSSITPSSSISTSTSASHLQQQQQQQQNHSNVINTTDVDLFKTNPGVGYSISPAPVANITTITSTPQAVPSTPTLHSLSPVVTGTGGTATSSGSSPAANTAFFDIHDKIRELYLYLLINDEKALKESRRRHRTRSFVLERLVEREKLNTIVLNLHPGNKGYSLAFYQHDKHDDILNEAQGNNASSTSYEGPSGSGTQADRGGGPGGGGGGGGGSGISSLHLSTNSSGHKVGTNASSSRLKQTQISSSSLNSSNSNNLLISSNNLDVDDEFDGAESDSAIAAAVDSFGDAIDSLSSAVQASNAASSINDNVLNTSSATADSEDIDEDANLVEIMRWPYEADDLLNSIDKEELPILFSDLLETRTPNVFYSGCVICQIRDFRQTFPISSNSCDIYHVLLKPTNDTLYSDINQLSIDSDISAEDKLMLESQLILATSEPLCLDPDPKIGRYAINSQHMRQIWNTPTLRRQMKKYSQISINRKRKIDQFTHNYGLELCDYLQRVRQRPRTSMISGGNTTPFVSGVSTTSSINSSNSSSGSTIVASFAAQKLPKKPADVIKPRPPNFEYPPLSIPKEVDVLKYAKAYENPKKIVDSMPQLIEEYILQTDREGGRVYHIKLSIFQRPSNSEYLGELYVDRDYREGERNGEACQFSLGTRFHANRYIEQFTEIFTEEDRKAVTITYKVPGKEPKVSYTTGMSERLKEKQQQQQAALAAALRQQQQQQQQAQQHSTQTLIAAAPQQQRQIHIQPSLQPAQQIIAPTLNATNASALPGNQLNSILQGANIVGIATAGNVQQLRQQPQQIFEATGTVSVQAQPTQQLSLSNGSLVLLQQQAPGSAVQTGLTIQNANQQKTQLLTSAGQLAATNAIRTQLGSSVPILQAQLKATPLVTGQQQQILQQKTQTNPTINALVTGLMNTANQFQQQQQQQQQVTVQQQSTQKSSNNAAILSLLNSTPAPMTNTPVVSNTFNPPAGQQQQAIVHQQSTHQTVTADTLIQQQPQQRKQNEAMQNLLTNNLRKINMVSGGTGGSATLGLTSGGRTGTNLIAVSAVGLNPDNTAAQNVRVTMSALASQLASPPAVMTNTSFAYTTTNNNNNSISLNNNNNIKIVNNTAQRVITANTLRRDSTATVAAPSPGSDSNASNASATSNLGFTMPGLSALLATSPSPNSDQSQTPHGTPGGGGGIANVTSTLGNQALIERLNSGTNVSTSPGLSPQQQSNVAKSIVQHVTNVQSPASSISPLSSPPPQPSPQQPVQQTAQTTTLNLQGINLTSLQGAMATFPGLQNVQVQIPGLGQPISLSLSSAGLAAAVQQQQQTAAGGQQGNAQQTTSLLVSVPVTSTTQVNTMQTVPGAGNCGTVVSVPATTQTVVLTNAATAGNSSSGVTGSMLSLPIAQFVTSGVKGLNAQTIRTATTGPSNSQNVVNANIIQTAGGGATLSSSGGNAITGTVNVSNTAGSQPIQLLSTIQQRPRSIQLVGAKQIANRGQLNQQRNTTSTIKIAAPITAPSQITTTANITASPLVMTTQKLQLKLHKQAAAQQQQAQQQQQIQQVQQQQGALQSQQQTQQQQHIQMSGAAAQQRLLAANAISVATPNQKRRRSATEINK